MILKIPKARMSFTLNYENVVAALAVVYFLETVYLITLHPTLLTVLKVIQFFLLGCIGVLFCIQSLTTNSMFVRLLVIAVFAISLVFSGTFPFLKYGIVLLTGLNCNTSKLYSKLLKIYIFCVAITFLLSIAGILPSRIVRRDYSTYGFIHANVFAQYLLSILCCFIILNEYRFQWKQWGISILLVAGTWYLTDSRTTVASMVFMLFLLALVQLIPKAFRRGHVLYYAVILLPAVLMLVSMLLCWNYDLDNSVLSEIDELLNGRLTVASNMAKMLQVTAFGQRVTMTLVESAYVTGLYQFGLIPMAVELVIYMYAIRKSMLNHSYSILICLLTIALHGMAESSTFSPFINIALFSVFSKHSAALPPQTRESRT